MCMYSFVSENNEQTEKMLGVLLVFFVFITD